MKNGLHADRARDGADQTTAPGASCDLPILWPGEALVGSRSSARLDTSELVDRGAVQPPRDGPLFVTTHRIIHVSDDEIVTIELDDIDDSSLASGKLLLTMKCGRGVTIDCRLLRQLHATVTALRAERYTSAR